MKRLYGVWFVCLVWCAAPACAGLVKNGSFEMDGKSIYITLQNRPKHWCGVSYNADKFAVYTNNDWSTEGNYSLTMYSYMGSVFEPNDAAELSQSVYLDAAKQLVFDLYLYADLSSWDTGIVTARVLIDGDEIWNSDGLQFAAGQFLGQVAIDINPALKDGNPHLLSLQLRFDVSSSSIIQYFSQWDFVRFNYGCGGLLPGDFNGDCAVDLNDLAFFANGWLKPDGPDLTGDGISNFADFAVFADYWGISDNSGSTQPPQDNLLDADLNDDGIVDLGDIIIFSENWLGGGGPCVRPDLNNNGTVDFADFSKIAQSWMQTGSLYGW
jgi:hypothetical protein